MNQNCRHCNCTLNHNFLDLGFSPPSNAYLTKESLSKPELTYPLRLFVCEHCWLVQTEDFINADSLFDKDYAYFSSTSKTWLEHAANFAEEIINFQKLDENSFVIEVGSNDGYFLRNFQNRGIPCLGIEPTSKVASVAKAQGIDVLETFFGTKCASSLGKADLIYGANVYAHVPDINDFTDGIASVLKHDGIAVLEFPHLMRLVEFVQFDTVYHEHFSYLSLLTVNSIMDKSGLRIFKVEELNTHGGSLRIFACKQNANITSDPSVRSIIQLERHRGMDTKAFYSNFQHQAERTKNEGLKFLIEAKTNSQSVMGYGAAAKGNTFLNFAGIKPDLIQFVCDSAESKIGKFLPGSHIPILSPDVLFKEPPDHLIIFPWNIASEIKKQLASLVSHGTRFWKFIPSIEEI
ncbi:class I SAM-dependent methyltransferase [Candidatus Saccharibacteria bacterium]|nr:class I SAM-dependent methyltransferase [Candidatus Saccharibacteria bacterium]